MGTIKYEDSAFKEFKEVTERFIELSKTKKENLPAMIILERKEDGENKHAMVGSPFDMITLFEWGIHQISDGYGISFENMIKLIQIKHDDTNHIMLNDIKKDLDNI